MYSFGFVSDSRLRKNIESIYNDVLDLGTLLTQTKGRAIKNCIRKTIVMYTGSIIEALLLWKLNEEIKKGNLDIKNERRFNDIGLAVSTKIKSENGNTIAIVERIENERKIEKIDFNERIKLCKENNIIQDSLLIEELHKARKLRNKIHIDGLKEVKKAYNKNDLNFVFQVLGKTIHAVK